MFRDHDICNGKSPEIYIKTRVFQSTRSTSSTKGTVNFRLPFVAYRCLCLSSLFNTVQYLPIQIQQIVKSTLAMAINTMLLMALQPPVSQFNSLCNNMTFISNSQKLNNNKTERIPVLSYNLYFSKDISVEPHEPQMAIKSCFFCLDMFPHLCICNDKSPDRVYTPIYPNILLGYKYSLVPSP